MNLLDNKDQKQEQLGAIHTAREIIGQPELWLKVYQQIFEDKERISSYLDESLPEVCKIILTGAGTSAFIGLSLHGTFNRSLKIHTDAVATTDLVSHPNNYFFNSETILLVSFSRSGNSPESVAVVDLADKLCKKCFHIIITCDATGQLARWKSDSTKLIVLLPPEANDKGLAMTGSYSGMLLCGFLLARLKEIDSLAPQIDILNQYGTKILNHYALRLKGIASLDFDRVVFLGSGPFRGTATESQLKLQELTDGTIICKNDSYLGFRHGPKAVTNENTLMVFIFSNDPYVQQYEKDLVLSMKKGKKALFTIGLFESQVNGLEFDLGIKLSESGSHLDEELLTVCDILPGQLLGFYKSLALGLKPDDPSESGAISRVVEDVIIYEY
ncbi:MAG: SIS domain-containing protein [Bacteroidetes bacterium]|nr:MAG: SIS domain-containing protein [Bacteroidota bacterium]